MRLDSLITEKFNLKSRTYASRLIKDGFVKVNNKTVLQPSKEVDGTEDFEILKEESFASFGGEKLKKAIEQFGISIADKYCVDVGCSNGGFTDCLLKEGAKEILAVDVGECALPKEILSNGKVEFLKDGNWKEVDCKYSSVPEAVLPDAINQYVKTNYAGQKVLKIEKEDRGGYEIKLSGGLELGFDKRFQLIDIDN